MTPLLFFLLPLPILLSSHMTTSLPLIPASEIVTQAQLVEIAPSSASCASTYPECCNATQAAIFINKSFQTYKITSPFVAAALVALMVFESAEFKYARNKFPGVPGQGTRNMQSPALNLRYLNSLLPQSAHSLSDPTSVLDRLVEYGEYDFGSAAWFLKTQCPSSVETALAAHSITAWSTYLSCIGTTETQERAQYWQRARQSISRA